MYAGAMTGCPSYLGMAIFNAVNFDLLVHRDLIVFCPPVFNVTVRLHMNPSLVHHDVDNQTMTSSAALVVRLFDADDSSYDAHLTHFRLFETDAVAAGLIKTANADAIKRTTEKSIVTLRLSDAVCVCGGLAAILVICYVGREVMRAAGSSKHAGISWSNCMFLYLVIINSFVN